MKYLYLYILDGFAALAVSYRPLDALHTLKRFYYKPTGATIERFFHATHKLRSHTDVETGTQIMIVELKGEVK